jgi:hypothetical protein
LYSHFYDFEISILTHSTRHPTADDEVCHIILPLIVSSFIVLTNSPTVPIKMSTSNIQLQPTPPYPISISSSQIQLANAGIQRKERALSASATTSLTLCADAAVSSIDSRGGGSNWNGLEMGIEGESGTNKLCFRPTISPHPKAHLLIMRLHCC